MRTWANKAKFPEFNNGYNEPQGNRSLSHSPEVQFREKATLLHHDENEKTKKETTKIAFTGMTAVY